MPNPVTASPDQANRHIMRPPALLAHYPEGKPFAPLFARTVSLVIATVQDELGRPLIGVFVPDCELL
jgi:hypothetical protein